MLSRVATAAAATFSATAPRRGMGIARNLKLKPDIGALRDRKTKIVATIGPASVDRVPELVCLRNQLNCAADFAEVDTTAAYDRIRRRLPLV